MWGSWYLQRMAKCVKKKECWFKRRLCVNCSLIALSSQLCYAIGYKVLFIYNFALFEATGNIRVFFPRYFLMTKLQLIQLQLHFLKDLFLFCTDRKWCTFDPIHVKTPQTPHQPGAWGMWLTVSNAEQIKAWSSCLALKDFQVWAAASFVLQWVRGKKVFAYQPS